jgi:hypothetical protein
MSKCIMTMTVIAFTLAVAATPGFFRRSVASGGNSMTVEAAAAPSAAVQGSLTLPRTNLYSITNDNSLYVLRPGSVTFNKVGVIRNINGQVIGIDFRVSDGQLYAYTDSGRLYTIRLSDAAATLVANQNPRFAGGVQSLLDFNPVVNAIRLIGSNDQNYAIVSSNGGNLNTTAVQTKIAYANGDLSAGVDPNLTGGSYTNNVQGAGSTIFYAIDYDTDNFVTIATRTNGSSNTGGGQLQTIGKFFDNNVNNGGQPVNFNPTADFDIFTDNNGVNTALVLNGNRLITLLLSQVNLNLPLGSAQNLGGFGVTINSSTGDTGFIDIAAQPPTF